LFWETSRVRPSITFVGIQDLLRTLLVERKRIDIHKLPSQGHFYPSGLTVSIKKAEYSDILDYETRFDGGNILRSLECIKTIVERNVIVGGGYGYPDIKSVDIVFLFLEIVAFTNGRGIEVPYKDAGGNQRTATFGPDNFNYFDFTPLMQYYNPATKEMKIDGYRFSFPSIGVENSLAGYIARQTDLSRFKDASFDFLFFLSGKRALGDEEIENLIQIFNEDLDEAERAKVSAIVARFSGIVSYSLLVDGQRVELKTNVNLGQIWDL